MWVTFFSLAMAVSVWFSAANLAVQLGKDRAVNAAIESREFTQLPNDPLSSAAITSRTSPDSRFN